MTIADPNIPATSIATDEPQLRDLFLFASGNRIFAVPADEVEGIVEAKRPSPLPHAPAPVVGVVYARGRMLTVVDPLAVTTEEAAPRTPVVPVIISLRGDEQLALAAESAVETITISSADMENTAADHQSEPGHAVAGILRHGGQTITVIDPARLFEAAVQRKDRRRRRF